MTPGKVYVCSELQKIALKKSYFRKILKIHKKIVNSQNMLLLFHRRENATMIKQQTKVEIKEEKL